MSIESGTMTEAAPTIAELERQLELARERERQDARASREAEIAPLRAAMAAARARREDLEARMRARLEELLRTEARAFYNEAGAIAAELDAAVCALGRLGIPAGSAQLPSFAVFIGELIKRFHFEGYSGAGPHWARE